MQHQSYIRLPDHPLNPDVASIWRAGADTQQLIAIEEVMGVVATLVLCDRPF